MKRFTAGSRTEDNLLVLKYCVLSSFKQRKPLIVTARDFSKAYDFIKRENLLEL